MHSRTDNEREKTVIVYRDDFCRRSSRRVTNRDTRTHALPRVASRLHWRSSIQGLSGVKVHDSLEAPRVSA